MRMILTVLFFATCAVVVPAAYQSSGAAPALLIVGENGVRLPAKVKGRLPVIPAGVEPRGTTILELIVSPAGAVTEARVLRPIRPAAPELDRAALDAAKTWEYKPTVVRGVAHPVRLRVSIDFSLAKNWK